MIGWVQGLLELHVVLPQATDPVPAERRAYLDPTAAPVDVRPQEIDVRALSTVPIGYEIGGGLELRHTIEVAVDVQHGDATESRRLRDLIVLDLALRALDVRDEIGAATDPTTGQTVTRVDWSVDYRPLGTSDTNESGVLTFTVDTILDR